MSRFSLAAFNQSELDALVADGRIVSELDGHVRYLLIDPTDFASTESQRFWTSKRELAANRGIADFDDLSESELVEALQAVGVRVQQKVTVKMWFGKASKARHFYSFSTRDRANEWVAEQIASEQLRFDRKAQQKAEDKKRADEFRENWTVGTLLHGSWGYDQTNCEFFEIVARPTKASAVIRRIAGREVKDSAGFMSCNLQPAPGQFVGEEIRKTIGPGGITMRHYKLTECTADASFYSSSYA